MSEFEFEGTRQFDEDRYEGELKWSFVKFFVMFIRGTSLFRESLKISSNSSRVMTERARNREIFMIIYV